MQDKSGSCISELYKNKATNKHYDKYVELTVEFFCYECFHEEYSNFN